MTSRDLQFYCRHGESWEGEPEWVYRTINREAAGNAGRAIRRRERNRARDDRTAALAEPDLTWIAPWGPPSSSVRHDHEITCQTCGAQARVNRQGITDLLVLGGLAHQESLTEQQQEALSVSRAVGFGYVLERPPGRGSLHLRVPVPHYALLVALARRLPPDTPATF